MLYLYLNCTIVINSSNTLRIANISIWLQQIIIFLIGRLLSAASFSTHCKFHKSINSRVYQLFFVIKTKLKLYSQTRDEQTFYGKKKSQTMSAFNVTNGESVHLTAWFVVKRKEVDYKNFLKGGKRYLNISYKRHKQTTEERIIFIRRGLSN
jgi:hypothetical protein